MIELTIPGRGELHLQHPVTADSHGQQSVIDHLLNVNAVLIQRGNESAQKAAYVNSLGADSVVAIGQGANDAGMLKTAAPGNCIFSTEGTATEALLAADLVTPDIHSALDLLDKPLRIIASLRK